MQNDRLARNTAAAIIANSNPAAHRLFLTTILLLIFSGLCIPGAASATVVNYPVASCFVKATGMKVTINGTPIDVRVYEPYANTSIIAYYYAHCGISGTVTVVADAVTSTTSCTISPKAYGISPPLVGTTVTFTLSRSRYIEIKFNGRPTLYLLADDIETSPPSPGGTYDVTNATYHADKTGGSLVTGILNQAITDANTHGGGIVYFPAGIYLSNKLTLKSNVKLYFAPGAVLYADPTAGNWGAPTGSNHFINTSGASNVQIYGRGTIACRGCKLANYLDPSDPANPNAMQINPIQMTNTNGITIDGVIVNESTAWTVNINAQCQNITITNLKVLNQRPDLDGQNWEWNDGIDFSGAHDATVSHCFISTVDDAACAKTGVGGYPTYNITYDDIVADSGHGNGFRVGAETDADIHDVTLSNFNVVYCHRGFDLIHWNAGGSWHDIHFVDWRVEKVGDTTANGTSTARGQWYNCPFRMEIWNRFGNGVGPISYVEVTRVTFDGLGPIASYLWGDSATNNINNVCFTDLSINGSLINGWGSTLVNKANTSAITWNTSTTPITFEGESLTAVPSGCTTTVVSDARFSNGQAMRIDSSAIGNYVDITLPAVPAGTYGVQVYFNSNVDRGQYQAQIGGVNQGAVQDQYGATQVYGLINDLGPRTIYATGDKVLRMTVTGKSGSSSGYKMLVDKVVLTK